MIFFSHPPSVTLWVKLKAGNCTPANVTVTEVLTVNMKELIKDQARINTGKIVVANSSKTTSSDDITSPLSSQRTCRYFLRQKQLGPGCII